MKGCLRTSPLLTFLAVKTLHSYKMAEPGSSVCIKSSNMQKEITLEETILEETESSEKYEYKEKIEDNAKEEDVQTEQTGPSKSCHFTWDTFFYQLVFGFLPSFVDTGLPPEILDLPPF